MAKKLSAAWVLEAKTPKTAAVRFHQWLQALDPGRKHILFRECGQWGGPEVIHEEGPYDWAVALCGGSSYYAGEFGNYSAPGPFPNALQGNGWYAEPGNSFSLTFHRY